MGLKTHRWAHPQISGVDGLNSPVNKDPKLGNVTQREISRIVADLTEDRVSEGSLGQALMIRDLHSTYGLKNVGNQVLPDETGQMTTQSAIPEYEVADAEVEITKVIEKGVALGINFNKRSDDSNLKVTDEEESQNVI
ncbi:hypothetical protein Q3G72_017043 [Acer saccharum]|nr:hypothetical protein Q3G72_017043 [Acer saccharum]